MAEPESQALQPIERSPLYEVVAARLKEFIEAENLEPGDRLLPERELAERLGVSRTSVRQALTAMRVSGVVDIRPGAGVFLRRPSADLVPGFAAGVADAEVDHPMIWEVREGIEVQAARLAARRRGDEDLAAMNEALRAMSRSIEDGGDGIDGDRLFHRAVAAAGRNDLLSRLVDELGDVMDRTSQVSLTLPGRAPRSLEAHRAILAAIEAGDEEAAAMSMRRHIAESAESVVSRHDSTLDR
jgi:GntR family transcriptional repressor for pyruvate dehydrogenase complex